MQCWNVILDIKRRGIPQITLELKELFYHWRKKWPQTWWFWISKQPATGLIQCQNIIVIKNLGRLRNFDSYAEKRKKKGSVFRLLTRTLDFLSEILHRQRAAIPVRRIFNTNSLIYDRSRCKKTNREGPWHDVLSSEFWHLLPGVGKGRFICVMSL